MVATHTFNLYALRLLLLLGGLACGMFSPLQAQDEKPKKITLNGYIKYMHTANFIPDPKNLTSTNLIHNRLNLKWYMNPNWRLAVEFRNRAFWGEEVKLFNALAHQFELPTYGQTIDQYGGLFDLSILWVDDSAFVLHTVFDRAYIEYVKGNWELRAGRQRINWGINSVWNPNDLFNAFNYLDFDYEERPGSDAIRVTYYTGLMSSLDVAFAPADTIERSVGAAMYKFNAKNYDVQVLGGYFKGDLALGLGWAGYIGGAGFQGEATYFVPTPLSTDSMQTITFSVSGDYQLPNGLYLSGSVYFNNRGATDASVLTSGVFGGNNLDAKSLYPTRWAFFANAMGQITPIWNASLGVIYSPYGHQAVFIPTVTHSIKENWDLDFICQSFFLDDQGKYRNLVTSVFLRLKWSF